MGFQQAAALQLIPHLVYALLRSPLLAVTAPSHPDLRAAVHYLWAGLPPQLLRCAIYPVLASYSDLDTQARFFYWQRQHQLPTVAAYSEHRIEQSINFGLPVEPRCAATAISSSCRACHEAGRSR